MLPTPMQVSDAVIALCRERVESGPKRHVRSLLLPLMCWRLGTNEIGEGFQFGIPVSIRGTRIGRYYYVGAGGRLSGPVSIGDLTMISTNVTLVGDDHVFDDFERPMRIAFPDEPRPATVIESDCWIGHGAILREGIHIRRGTVVAAGAVVTHDTEPYSVVGGVPAKLIKKRFLDSAQQAHDRLLYG